MNNIRAFAPYVYLAKENDQTYHLFFTFRHGTGDVVNKPTVEHVNGMTLVEINIMNNGTNGTAINEQTNWHEILLVSEMATSFNPQTFSVSITCRIDKPPTDDPGLREIKVQYRNSGEFPDLIIGQKAFNIPYFYAKDEATVTLPGGQLKSTYRPSCLVLLNGTELDANNTTGTTRGDSFEQEIHLSPLAAGNTALTEVNPNDLTCNTITYDDIGFVNGFFEVTVVETNTSSGNTTTRRRKGRILNTDSDQNNDL